MGFFLPGRCRPTFGRGKKNGSSWWWPFSPAKTASQLEFSRIKEHWGYEGGGGGETIPTLEEWLDRFARREEIKLFWMDVKVKKKVTDPLSIFRPKKGRRKFKVQEVDRMPELVRELDRLFASHGLPWSKVLLSAGEDRRAEALSKALRRIGTSPSSRVVADTVSFSPWVPRGTYDGGVAKVCTFSFLFVKVTLPLPTSFSPL